MSDQSTNQSNARQTGKKYKTTAKQRADADARYLNSADAIKAKLKKRYQNDPEFRMRCKERSKKAKHRKKQSDPELYRRTWREGHLRRTYGIGIDEYESLLGKQNGTCAICQSAIAVSGRNDSLHVDHNHETGEIRGLLCMLCNRGIGAFRDDVELLKNAIEYLCRKEKHAA